jgi:Fe-S-cluster containining protein
MPTPAEIAELVALDKATEKETVRKLRENRRVAFAVQFAAFAQSKVDQVRDDVVRKGVRFDCKKGCAWCCHFAVDAFPQESFRIARELKARGDTAAIVAALESYVVATKDAKTFRRGTPCVFLVDDACSIYAVRPLMCRKCNSLDVAKCKDPQATVPENPELAHKTGAIMHGTISAYGRNKLPAQAHDLARSVLRALTDSTAETRWYAGAPVFDAPATELAASGDDGARPRP